MSTAQREYLARVLPWPMEGEAGYVNIHWTWEPPDHQEGARYQWSGRAVRTLRDAEYALTHLQSGTRDIYACQSRQSAVKHTRHTKNGWTYYIPDRLQTNAICLKSLFLDIDFKDYNSQSEITEGLENLLTKTSLPFPSVIVDTTGGYHVYWTLDRVLTPAEWHPLSHALVEACRQANLKIDAGCSIDSARVLRIPDTTNFKRNQLVRLTHCNDFDYSVERIEKTLLPFKVTTVKHTNGHKIDHTLFPQRDPLSDDDPLAAGIEQIKLPPIDIKEILPECEFLRTCLATGGADCDNTLWNLTTLISTFLDHGDYLAHRLGNKHKTYTKDSTDALYARKLKEKAEKGIGWPQCQTIYGSGSKVCKTCPHFGKGKSPLNFRTSLNNPPPPPPKQPPPGVKATSVLPPGYQRNAQGLIEKLEQQDDGSVKGIPICDISFGDAWVQKNPWILNFSAEVQPGRTEQISLPLEVIGAIAELRKELARQGLTVQDHSIKPVEAFLLSWITTLKHTKDAVVSTEPFGWHVDNGKLAGFVYGTKLFTPTDVRVAQSPDAVTAKGYSPTGEIDPWIAAAKLITDQQRPALDTILASTFAAPLVVFTNQRGLMISCIGESGIGKSTALDTGLAAWGHPVRAKNLLHDTDNSVMNKVGELRALPIYWDDLQPDDTRKYARMVFQMSYGKEKDRLGQNAKRRESGTWQTIMISTSNYSLMDHVAQHTSTTTAGIYRIFEIKVDSGKGGPGQIAKVDAARIIGKLDYNYGVVGLKYAEFLGKNFSTIEGDVLEYQKALDIEVDAQNEERLWTSVIACVCLGARYANQLGLTNINEEALRKFLVETLTRMRGELKNQAVDMSEDLNVSSILSNFLNANRARNTLITNLIHKGRGKPAAGSIKVLSNTQRLEDINVHIGVDDKLMRITSTALSEWLREKEISRHAFTTALKEKFGMKVVNGRIGSGTEYVVNGLNYMLELDLVGLDLDVDDIVDLDPVAPSPVS